MRDDPPWRRDHKRRGQSTFQNDRPPAAGLIGRSTGRVRLRAIGKSGRRTLEALAEETTSPNVVINTDEWRAYGHLSELGPGHATVNYSAKEWARDEDGDGVREVHIQTMAVTWTGLRNLLRPFRGVSKWHLAWYVAVFEWAHNLKRVADGYLATLVGRPRHTARGA